MKDIILNEIKKNGIFISNQLLNDFEKDNLQKDFSNKKNYELLKINEEGEIRNVSQTLFNFLKKDYINDFLVEYLGNDFQCTNILFTRTKPELKKEDVQHIREGNVLGFHNDDSGKQIKINILLSDLNEKSNGLEYAASSHKIDKLDRYLIFFFKIFGLLKNWNKHFLNYQKNKIKGQKVNFMSEKDVKKKFNIIKVFGKSGLIYIFDTNGFHRQASVNNENLIDSQRELITVYLNTKI